MSVSLQKILGIGCGDNSCRFGSPGGMATNGGCRCFERSSSRMSSTERNLVVDISMGLGLLRELAELPRVEVALREIARRIRENERERATLATPNEGEKP